MRSTIIAIILCFLASTSHAAETASGLYAQNCIDQSQAWEVEIRSDGSARVVRAGRAYEDLLTSYSFFGDRTPNNFHTAILFDRDHNPLEELSNDGRSWLEIWKIGDSYFLLENGEENRRFELCQTAADDPVPTKPSFDCTKAQGQIEELICSDVSLAALDRQLTADYREARSRVSGEDLSFLKAEQRGWIKGRNDCWKATDQRQCTFESYRDRLAILSARYGLVMASQTYSFKCTGGDIAQLYVTYFQTDPPSANLVSLDNVITVLQQRSASGAKFEGAFGVTFWTKGNEAQLEWPQGSQMQCQLAN
jgi:uncharacterized protein